MKRGRFQQDFGLKLMALYILFVGPVIAAMLWIAHTTQSNLEDNIKAADLALARSIAQETDFAMRNALLAIEELSSYDAVIESNVAGMAEIFNNFMSARPEVNLVYRLDEAGQMVFHHPIGPTSTVGDDFSFREYFSRALASTAPLISRGRISPTTNQPVATAVMPLWDGGGKFLGVVATNIRLEALSQTLTKISHEYGASEGFEVFIIDSSNQIIAHSNTDLLLTKIPESHTYITDPLLLGRVDSVIVIAPDGVERLYSYVPVSSAGWGVIVSRPADAAFSTPRTFYRSALITLVIFLITSLIFWVGLTRLVIQPLGAISAYSRTIGQQHDSSQPRATTLPTLARRPDQVGRLAHSMMRMEESIEARFKELSTLLETSASVVSTLEPKAVLDRILEEVERLLHSRMIAIIALDEQSSVFRVRASRGLSEHYVNLIAIDPTEPHSVSLRALRTGEPIQISDTETNPSFAADRAGARAEGYRAVLALPLNTHYAPPSVLLVFREKPYIFTEQEISLLSNFANHAAMAIENAALFARSDMRLQEQTRRLEALILSLNAGLILAGPEGRVIYANRRISTLSELPLQAIIGAEVDRILEHIIQHSTEPKKSLQQIMDTLASQEDQIAEFFLMQQGRTFWYRLRSFSVTDIRGVSLGQGIIINDITADRELDRMKSNLISTVSHELRTPLASIKGYASTLLAVDVEWDYQSQQEFLKIISDEADRLTVLVNELLDLSRIDAGSLKVERRPCDLGALIDRAAKRASPTPDSRLRVELPADLPALYADQRHIEVVLRNIIENAAKYSGPESPIYVRASFNEEQITIAVADEGPGIHPDEGERIFNSFYRIENGLSRNTSGAGLGLAICKGFIQAHQGSIWLEPTERGACFMFSLPRNPKNGA